MDALRKAATVFALLPTRSWGLFWQILAARGPKQQAEVTHQVALPQWYTRTR